VVEAAVLEALGPKPIRNLVDLGTGTGRMLQLLAPRAARTVGLDASHAMLSVARANLEKAGLSRIELRQGDIYAPPFPRDTFDLVVIHQVLHYLDDPARAIREAARLVAPGGRILVVDFAPHNLEFLRVAQAHRRLGFSPDQVAGWLDEAGLDCTLTREIAPSKKNAEQLIVSLWLGQDRRAVTDWPLLESDKEVA
jgi:ubiquinone/menaquinone biosynthesis C-methylase UbiE